MKIILRGSADDQLRTLSGRSEFGRMTVFNKFLLILDISALDLPHRRQNGFFTFVRSKELQSALGREFDIYAQTVCQQPQLFYQFRRSAGNGLCVDIPVETVRFP